jgi:hypothetical protein
MDWGVDAISVKRSLRLPLSSPLEGNMKETALTNLVIPFLVAPIVSCGLPPMIGIQMASIPGVILSSETLIS